MTSNDAVHAVPSLKSNDEWLDEVEENLSAVQDAFDSDHGPPLLLPPVPIMNEAHCGPKIEDIQAKKRVDQNLAVSLAFRKSKIGGGVIMDFSTKCQKNQYKQLKEFNSPISNSLISFLFKPKFSMDFFFFHPKYGLCILVTKATGKEIEQQSKSHHKIVEEWLTNLWRILFPNVDPITIFKFACLPFECIIWSKFAQGWRTKLEEEGIFVIDRQHLDNEERFIDAFYRHTARTSVADMTEMQHIYLELFWSFLVFCASTVTLSRKPNSCDLLEEIAVSVKKVFGRFNKSEGEVAFIQAHNSKPKSITGNNVGVSGDQIGQESETAVFHAFQRLSIGGIIIQRFSRKLYFERFQQLKNVISHEVFDLLMEYDFEIDFIFAHHRYGLWIFETKSGSTTTRATGQLEKNELWLSNLSSALLNATFEIKKVICLPEGHVHESKTKNFNKAGICVIEKDKFVEQGVLQNIFISSRTEEVQVNFLRRFTSFLTYCATTVSFVMGNNVLLQDYLRTKTRRRAELIDEQHGAKSSDNIQALTDSPIKATNFSNFYLTADQQRVLHSDHTRLVLSGVPGSGKTLLLKILALKYLRKGRLILLFCPESLMANYMDFFVSNFFNKQKRKSAIRPGLISKISHAKHLFEVLQRNHYGLELEREERAVIISTEFLAELSKHEESDEFSWNMFVSFRDYELFSDEFGRFEASLFEKIAADLLRKRPLHGVVTVVVGSSPESLLTGTPFDANSCVDDGHPQRVLDSSYCTVTLLTSMRSTAEIFNVFKKALIVQADLRRAQELQCGIVCGHSTTGKQYNEICIQNKRLRISDTNCQALKVIFLCLTKCAHCSGFATAMLKKRFQPDFLELMLNWTSLVDCTTVFFETSRKIISMKATENKAIDDYLNLLKQKSQLSILSQQLFDTSIPLPDLLSNNYRNSLCIIVNFLNDPAANVVFDPVNKIDKLLISFDAIFKKHCEVTVVFKLATEAVNVTLRECPLMKSIFENPTNETKQVNSKCTCGHIRPEIVQKEFCRAFLVDIEQWFVMNLLCQYFTLIKQLNWEHKNSIATKLYCMEEILFFGDAKAERLNRNILEGKYQDWGKEKMEQSWIATKYSWNRLMHCEQIDESVETIIKEVNKKFWQADRNMFKSLFKTFIRVSEIVQKVKINIFTHVQLNSEIFSLITRYLQSFKAEEIAIILVDVSDSHCNSGCAIIREFVQENFSKWHGIKIRKARDTCSEQWPAVVVVVSEESVETNRSYLLAISRAMVELSVIKLRQMDIIEQFQTLFANAQEFETVHDENLAGIWPSYKYSATVVHEMSNSDHRAVVRFFTQKGLNAIEITKELSNVYKDSAPSYLTITKWVAEFKDPAHFEDTLRSGRPSTSTLDESA